MSRTPPPFGFNVIGHVTGNLGLGVAVRNLIALIEAHGYPVSVYDVDPGKGRIGNDRTYEHLRCESLQSVPYAINLFMLGMSSLEAMLESAPDSLLDGRRMNVAACFWELSTIPPVLTHYMQRMDVVVGMSDYMAAVNQLCLSGPTMITGRLPVALPPVTPDRARFGLRPDDVAFVCSFEPHSDIARKNPFAVLEAFVEGPGHDENAVLVVRLNNARAEGRRPHPAVERLEAYARSHERIRISSEPMSYPEVLQLYASCDVYVSLHRAEGFGLGLAEAMVLGKVVVATGWSGNMSFMNHRNSCVVPYVLANVDGTIEEYLAPGIRRIARWADPDVKAAAALMSNLARHPALRSRIGHEARQSMIVRNRSAHQAAFLHELNAIWEVRSSTEVLRGRAARGATRRMQMRVGYYRAHRKLSRLWRHGLGRLIRFASLGVAAR